MEVMFQPGYWVSFEAIPSGMISEVVLNPEASNLLHQQTYDHDMLLELSALTTPFRNGRDAFPVPNRFGRAVEVAQCEIAYGKNAIGYSICTKGVLASGFCLEPDDEAFKLSHESPLGMFGLEAAQFDMSVSNFLIQAGHRVALPLGYIVMDPHKLEEYIKEKWYGVELGEFMLKGLSDVLRNGDTPVNYMRLGATAARLNEFDSLTFRRGLESLHYSLIGRNADERAIQAVVSVLNKQRPSPAHCEALYCELMHDSSRLIEDLYRFNSCNIHPTSFDIKDIDHGFICYDFEQGSPLSSVDARKFYEKQLHHSLLSYVLSFGSLRS